MVPCFENLERSRVRSPKIYPRGTDLLRRLVIVYPGPEPYDLDEHTRVIAFEDLGTELARLGRKE